VSSWWAGEARKYGVQFDEHDDRYARTAEWLEIVDKMWREDHFSYSGDYYKIEDAVMQPKPIKKPIIYAGGESEKAKDTIARLCDAYVMHGDAPDKVKTKIDGMERRREQLNLPPMIYGVAGYTIVRETETAVKKEIERITDVKQSAAGYGNYQDWLTNTKLEQQVSLEDYSVSNRGLRSGLTGTPAQVADKVGDFERAGVSLLLLQCSPQIEEMERFYEAIIKKSSTASVTMIQ
jgi:FMNH2-dependent dimethyl sulfone monooxygenase